MTIGVKAKALAEQMNDLLNQQPFPVQMAALVTVVTPRMVFVTEQSGAEALVRALEMFTRQVVECTQESLHARGAATQIRNFIVEVKTHDAAVQSH